MIAVSSFGLGFSLLLQSVAVAATLAVGSEITKRDDYNAITYQGGEVAPYCTSSEVGTLQCLCDIDLSHHYSPPPPRAVADPRMPRVPRQRYP